MIALGSLKDDLNVSKQWLFTIIVLTLQIVRIFMIFKHGVMSAYNNYPVQAGIRNILSEMMEKQDYFFKNQFNFTVRSIFLWGALGKVYFEFMKCWVLPWAGDFAKDSWVKESFCEHNESYFQLCRLLLNLSSFQLEEIFLNLQFLPSTCC